MSAPLSPEELSPEQRAAMTAALARTEPATGEHVRQALSDALSIRGHSHQPLVVERLRRVEARVPAIVRRLLDAEARLADAELPPTGRKSAAEYRLAQYAQPPRTFESATERALFKIAIELRQVLADTRARRDDARAGRADAEAEVERLRASAEGAHRRIDAVLDHLATLDAVQLSEDAGALGFHIVATLDSPVHADEEVPARPALPWRSFLEDVEQSALVEDLASLFLDYWRGDRPDDAATLREVEQLLVTHRDGSQVAEAARAAHGDLDAVAEAQFAAEAGHGTEHTDWRAWHDSDASMPLGQYTGRQAAMGHVHHVLAREESTTAAEIEKRVMWRADDPTGPEDEPTAWECWLTDADGEDEQATGYVVSPVEVAAAYDPDGDE